MTRKKNFNYSDYIISEDEKIYHEQSKNFLSSHSLADFKNSPLLFYKKKHGLIKEIDSTVYLLGRATHTYILEGETVFKEKYAIGGPINPNTGNPYGSNTKAFKEWEKLQGKMVITHDQLNLIEEINHGFITNDSAKKLLSEGIPEGVIRGVYCNMPCQIRMDWFNPEKGLIDLKTCDDLRWFESDARKFNYIYQMAFYRAVLFKASGDIFPVYIIACEKKEPFRCGVWRIGEDILGIAQKENESAIRRLKKCYENNHWPTGYEDMRIFDYL